MDGLFRGILGILIGAGLYSEVFPLIEGNLLKLGDYGKLTIPTLLGVNPWFVIVPFAMVVGGILLWMDRIDKGNGRKLIDPGRVGIDIKTTKVV